MRLSLVPRAALLLAAFGFLAPVAARAHPMLLAMDISRFLERDYDPAGRPRPPQNPPGSPIGDLPPFDR